MTVASGSGSSSGGGSISRSGYNLNEKSQKKTTHTARRDTMSL